MHGLLFTQAHGTQAPTIGPATGRGCQTQQALLPHAAWSLAATFSISLASSRHGPCLHACLMTHQVSGSPLAKASSRLFPTRSLHPSTPRQNHAPATSTHSRAQSLQHQLLSCSSTARERRLNKQSTQSAHAPGCPLDRPDLPASSLLLMHKTATLYPT